MSTTHSRGQHHFVVPNDSPVHAAISPRSKRDMAHAARFLRTLPELEPTTEGSNQFSSNGNSLIIDYGERDDIAISIQNGQSSAETLIHVAPGRIKIAGKFSILTRELYEDNGRDSVGTRNMQVPNARVHVLLVSPKIFLSTVCVQVNADKYYLEWRPCTRNNERAYTAHVTTDFMYQFRLAAAEHGRQMIRDPMNYFRGQQIPQERPRNDMQPQQQAEIVEAAAAVENLPNIAAQDDQIEPNGEQVVFPVDTASAPKIETLAEAVVAPENDHVAADAPENIAAENIVPEPGDVAVGEPAMDAETAALSKHCL